MVVRSPYADQKDSTSANSDTSVNAHSYSYDGLDLDLSKRMIWLSNLSRIFRPRRPDSTLRFPANPRFVKEHLILVDLALCHAICSTHLQFAHSFVYLNLKIPLCNPSIFHLFSTLHHPSHFWKPRKMQIQITAFAFRK